MTESRQPGIKRKLIEVALPLEAINRESTREKSIHHGHPSTLHLWWARRPLAACRAVLFAQLIDDPSSHPELFPSIEAQSTERRRLLTLIEKLAIWENAEDENLLRQAQTEIAGSFPGGLPTVADPFAGGGSIPLEAKRLGLPAWASDLNPLALLLNTVTLDLVDRFKRTTPITAGLAASAAQAMSVDLRYYAKILEDRAAARVASAYEVRKGGGQPLVYFWARTAMCPNPACHREIPLVGSWRLSSRRGSEAFLRPVPSPDGVHIDVSVHNGKAGEPPGTMIRTGALCPVCASAIPLAYIKSEGVGGRLGNRMLAIQERRGRVRNFAAATDEDRALANVASTPASWLDMPLSTHPQYMAPPRYGLTTFRDLFLPRQLMALGAFVEELEFVRDRVVDDAEAAGMSRDGVRFASGGRQADAYGDAMQILLALGVSRLVNRQSTLCMWDAGGMKVQQVFARQAYSMTWFFVEASPFAGASGSFAGQIDYLAGSLAALPAGEAVLCSGAAQTVKFPDHVVVSTDPPYYDNVPYSDLSDFFYVWLRPMLVTVLPELFATVLTPKSEELVADQVRLGGRAPARKFFEEGMRDVFKQMRMVHDPGTPMTVYYAFKQTEEILQTGTSSTGWETMLSALFASGWSVVGTWPIRTEQGHGLRELGRNALASSIVIVCRVQLSDAPTTTRRGFIQALRADLPKALRELQQAAIAPVDLAQAAIGPGMAVFTRYRTVVEADGAAMTVRTALALINEVLDGVLTEQEGDFDSDTRFCLKWFAQYGWNEAESGTADTLSRATNTSVAGLERSGIFRARAGRARLLGPDDLSDNWDPIADERVSVWEVVVRIATVLDAKGGNEAARLLALAGQRVDLDTAKELAYLLFSICEKRGWTAAALLFNGLGTSWSELSTTARGTAAAPRPAQGSLDFVEEEA